MSRELPISDVRPTQLYISREKLAGVLEWFDVDPVEYDFELYLQCIEWCEDTGVDSVADFRGRILEPETFRERWIERCNRAAGDPQS